MKTLTLGAALLVLAGANAAQQIDSVAPQVGSPGDLVLLRGSGFNSPIGGQTTVDFTANVGGFVGQWTEPAQIVSQTNTEIWLLTPDITAGFVPPVAGGTPYGALTVSVEGAGKQDAPFYFVEGVDPPGSMDTLQVGTSQSTGQGKPVIDFELDFDEPAAGVTAASFRVQNAIPGALCFLLAGAEATPPYLPFGDGSFVLSPSAFVFLTQPPVAASATGAATHKMSIPISTADETIALQWVVLDFAQLDIAVSTALRITL